MVLNSGYIVVVGQCGLSHCQLALWELGPNPNSDILILKHAYKCWKLNTHIINWHTYVCNRCEAL